MASGETIELSVHNPSFMAREVQLQVFQRGYTTQRLDRVDFTDRPAGPRNPTNRVTPALEELVVSIRHELREQSVLGEFGAAAIDRELKTRGVEPVPSLRTLGRILERRGLLDGRRRVRRRPPAKGWYVPEVAAGRAEIDEEVGASGHFLTAGQARKMLIDLRENRIKVEMPDSDPTEGFLRKAMLDALLNYRPKSKDEFRKKIPIHLRGKLDARQFAQYYEEVFSILAQIVDDPQTPSLF